MDLVLGFQFDGSPDALKRRKKFDFFSGKSLSQTFHFDLEKVAAAALLLRRRVERDDMILTDFGIFD